MSTRSYTVSGKSDFLKTRPEALALAGEHWVYPLYLRGQAIKDFSHPIQDLGWNQKKSHSLPSCSEENLWTSRINNSSAKRNLKLYNHKIIYAGTKANKRVQTVLRLHSRMFAQASFRLPGGGQALLSRWTNVPSKLHFKDGTCHGGHVRSQLARRRHGRTVWNRREGGGSKHNRRQRQSLTFRYERSS